MNWFEAFDLKTGQSYKVAEITEEVLNLLGPGLTGSYGVGDFIVAPAEENSTFRFLTRAHFAVGLLPVDSDGEHPLVPKEWHGLCYYPLARQKMPAPYEYVYFRGVCAGRPVEGVGYATTSGKIVRVGNTEVAVEDPEWPYDAIFAWHPIPDYDWEAAQ